MSDLLHFDSATIQGFLEGRTITSIMFGCRSDDFSDEHLMNLMLTLDNGTTVDLWAMPGDFTGTTLQEFFDAPAPRPFLAVSQLIK